MFKVFAAASAPCWLALKTDRPTSFGTIATLMRLDVSTVCAETTEPTTRVAAMASTSMRRALIMTPSCDGWRRSWRVATNGVGSRCGRPTDKGEEALAEATDPRTEDVAYGDRADEDRAREHGGQHVREAGDEHALAQEAQQEHGDDDAAHAAFAAENADATEDDHRDGRKQQDIAHVGTCGAVVRGQHETGECRHHPADDVRRREYTGNAYAGVPCGLAVVTDRDEFAAERAASYQ